MEPKGGSTLWPTTANTWGTIPSSQGGSTPIDEPDATGRAGTGQSVHPKPVSPHAGLSTTAMPYRQGRLGIADQRCEPEHPASTSPGNFNRGDPSIHLLRFNHAAGMFKLT